MTIKKQQHLIPQCYLKSFVDSEPPPNVPDNKYHPSVWLLDKSLKNSPNRKAPKNILWKSYFYNLKQDDLEQPYVEDFLSKVEGRYSQLLDIVDNQGHLGEEDQFILALFIDTLYRRTENQLNYWGETIEKLENIYRQVDRSINGNEKYSDEYFADSSEIPKKMIVDASGTIANLVLKIGFNLLKNESEIPFFTSDTPVLYNFIQIDELLNQNIPGDWTYPGIGKNEKEFFCFCPLTPKVAFISSPFIKSVTFNPKYLIVKEPTLPIRLNLLTKESSKEEIVSSIKKPFRSYQTQILDTITISKALQAAPKKSLRIYTHRNRYDIPVLDYERINDHPLQPIIKFWTKDLESLKEMANDNKVTLVEFFDKGKKTGGTRNLIFESISIHPDTPTVLKADW